MNVYRVNCTNIGWTECNYADKEFIIASNNETEAETIAQELYKKENGEESDNCKAELMTKTDNGYDIQLA